MNRRAFGGGRRSGRLCRTRRLGVLASAPMLAAVILIAAARTPGYSSSADTISLLGSPGQSYAWLARAGLVIYGFLVVAGSSPVAERAVKGATSLVWLVGLYGAAGVVAGLAPKHGPRGGAELLSQVHVAATIVGGGAIIAAMVMVACRSPLRSSRVLAALAAAVTAAATVTFRFSWGTATYGLVERILVAAAALWVSVLALPTRSAPGPPAVTSP